jgi:DNA polymerase-3 subunit alpha
VVAYQTAFLKYYYPVEFMAALMTSVIDNSSKVAGYIIVCKNMGIRILPPDINASHGTFSVDGDAIRFGLAAVRNVGEGAIENVVAERGKGGPFTSLVDFCSRVDSRILNKRVMESLVKCGAFDSLGAKRSQLLHILDRAISEANTAQKDRLSGQIGLFADENQGGVMDIPLPEMEEVPEMERLGWEKEITGFYYV